MPREFIRDLQGNVRKEAIDIYDRIDKYELRKSYLSHVPQLGPKKIAKDVNKGNAVSSR
jgi:hypothetical protein